MSVVGFDCGDEFNVADWVLILAMEPSEEVAAVGDLPLVVEIVEDGANQADDTASLGIMPTTRARRLISRLLRSTGVKAGTSALAASIGGLILGSDSELGPRADRSCFKVRKNPHQNTSSSELPTSRPRISCHRRR